MDHRAEIHLKRWGQLHQHMSLWLPTWQELAEFIMPRKANVNLRRSPGQPQTDRLIDSTGVHANELLAASMQGSLTSGSVKWFYFRVEGLPYGEDTDIDAWLEAGGDKVYDEIRVSNFAAESHEYYADLGCFGTAAMFIDRKAPAPGSPWNGLLFKTLPPGSYVVAENPDGRVDTLYYKFKLSARQAEAKFGRKNLPAQVVKHLTGGDPDVESDYIHAVYPRTDPALLRGKDVIAPKDRAWASLWISAEGRQVVNEGGFHEFPFAVARWTKASGEMYGRSPGHTALADLKTLNKLVELKLRALANMVLPPLMIRDDGVLSGVRLFPGGQTHVRDMESVKELLVKGDIGAGMLVEDKLQAAVRRIFFSDQLQLQEGPQMTAYEVQVRYELMQRILGPTLGRLETEYLDPTITRVYNLVDRAKLMLPPPPSLRERLGNKPLKIQYEGPLQRAQRLGEVVTIQRFFQIALPLIEADQETADNIDFDETMRAMAEGTGVPARIIRSVEKRDARREERRNQQAAVTQNAERNEAMKAVGSAAPALKALVGAQQAGILPQGGMTGQGLATPGVGR